MIVVADRIRGETGGIAGVEIIAEEHLAKILIVAHHADDRGGVIIQWRKDGAVAVGPGRHQVL